MKIKNIIIIAFLALVMASCQKAGKNSTGSEYMPDMGHSVAYEANVRGYYSLNRWGTEQSYYDFTKPRKPVAGTIARGAFGSTDGSNGGKSFTANGNVPYYYTDTEEERTRASQEIIKNPYPITERGLARGKELYNINCAICHGEKGDGNGYLVRDGGKYPAQPANLVSDPFITSTNGRFYHSIMYGKNVMGSYSDKLSFEERWQVIHYIRSMQAGAKGLVYNSKLNTLNTVDVPSASIVKVEAPIVEAKVSVESPVKEAASTKKISTTEHKGNH